jgi:hypothetical protein
MINLNLGQVFYNENDEVVVNLPGEPWTLRHALSTAMIETPQLSHPSEHPTAQEKLARYSLWKRLKGAGSEIALSGDEVSLAKKAAGSLLTPLFYGQVTEILDGTFKPPVAEAGA